MSNMPTLDEKSIQRLTPGTRAVLHFDGHPKAPAGFALRVYPTGRKAWVLRYHAEGKARLITLERGWPAWPVEKARREAQRLKLAFDSGIDPLGERQRIRAERKAAKAEREAQENQTLGRLLTVYCDELSAAGKQSSHEVELMVKRHVAGTPLWTKPAADFSARDAVALLHPLVSAGKRRQAAKLRAALRAAFHRAAGSHTDASASEALRALRVELDPLASLATIDGANKARDRALSLDELRAYWKRLQSLPEPDGAMLRFHLLTGAQRLEQLARATVDDLADSVMILRDGKGRRSEPRRHPVPLLPEAATELERMHGGEFGPYVFTANRGESGAAYAVIQHRVRAVAAEMVEAGEAVSTFTPGDLRRTVETRLAAAGVGQDIRAHLQSHGLGGIQQRHYVRHDFSDEVRAALETLRSLLTAAPATVTPIKRARKS